MDATVKILSVVVGTTSNGKQYFDVNSSDGETRRCWNAALAQKINSFANNAGQGPEVTLRFDVKQNGQYTNTSIKAAFGPGEPVIGEAVPMGTGGGQPMQAAGQQQGGGGGRGFPPEVTTRITKLAAYDYAATLIAGLFAGAGPDALVEATEALDNTAKHIYKQARAHEQGGVTTTGTTLPQGDVQSTEPIQAVATTPEGVAAALPPGTVQVGATVAQAQDASAESADVVDWN